MTDLLLPPDPASRLKRGVRRHLLALGLASLSEFTLRNGRRADLIALSGDGQFSIIEVKSGVVDFRTDQKWPDYRLFCDRFYFAVAEDFPQALIPDSCGLLVADAFGAAVVRDSPVTPLAPARRKALLLDFASSAALRLHGLEDPGGHAQAQAGRPL